MIQVKELQRQRQEQEKNGITPQIQRFPSSTSKFALKVYSEVFDALTAYNIRFKAEFNYLSHHLYQRTSDTKENGLRADLLVQVDLAGLKKPLTIVIEVQG